MFQAEWKEIRNLNLSQVSRTICNAAWASSTRKQYSLYIRKFRAFCRERGVTDYLRSDVSTAIDFLASLYQCGHSYSSINTARSALSQFVVLNNVDGDFGKLPVTIRFMKGVFKLRKPTTRYKSTWDVNLVLNVIKDWDIKSISLKELSFKTVMLLALSTGQRTQTLAEMKLSNAKMLENKIVFVFDVHLKTSRPGNTTIVEVCRFANPSLCPFSSVNEYIARSSGLRGNTDHLFLSYQKPHGKVSSQTIARWLSTCLRTAGVNDMFTAHSVRGASSSKAATRVDINCVLKVCGWSNAQTFAKFYNRAITDDFAQFSSSVLSV